MKTPIDADGNHGRFIIPAAAIAAGLACQVAVPAPGDLDPTFGDVGRATLPPDLDGAVWSLEASLDGEYTYAGGDEDYCGYYYDNCVPDGFTSSLLETGLHNPGFATSLLGDIDVRDVARQADRKQVVVGRRDSSYPYVLVAYRLMPDGSRDTAFGTDGTFVHSSQFSAEGKSVEVDADGRIVIAGIDHSILIVLRLKPNGTLDETFSEAGVYRGVAVPEVNTGVEAAKAPAGGYRVLTASAAGCVVTAITANGTLDDRFGQLGYAVVGTPGGSSISCRALAVQPDGRVIIGGVDATGAMVVRLRADGSADPTFVGAEVQQELGSIFSLALAPDGSIIAGASEKESSPAALVVRLRPDGRLDPGFGIAGRARIDLQSMTPNTASARTVRVLRNGGVLVGGRNGNKPFVAKLLAAGGSPGVLGFNAYATVVDAKNQRAVVVVRRTGGIAGAVGIAYETAAGSAQPGRDFTPVTGRLDWVDGDSGDRSITVPIASDSVSAGPERFFRVVLTTSHGGAGIGSSGTNVVIRGASYPAGVFSIESSYGSVAEPLVPGSHVVLRLQVQRQYYGAGAVSVTVTPQSGSATLGDDFQLTPVTLNWADGEMGGRVVEVVVFNDGKRESEEAFSIVLSSPTGGAAIGTASATVAITDMTPTKNSGGGGRMGVPALLLLGFARYLRRRPD